MTLRIAGMGWITPLGRGLDEVWKKLLAGEKAKAEKLDRFDVYRVPSSALENAPRHPRLRRVSAISRFGVVAGLDALADAQIQLDAESAKRTAIIFAISNGGVIYTKRFYHDIVTTGAQTASPLLFPETVFNAPASHLAAILGITGASYTLVGDGAVGILALKMAEDLMLDDSLDRCLVVGAEEADSLLCDAYHRWRLPMTLSEGAGAILLNRTGEISIEKIDAGENFAAQTSAQACVEKIEARLGRNDSDCVITSAHHPLADPNTYAPKGALGESVGTSSLWQVICAAQALRTQLLPVCENFCYDRVIVSACGLNQQAAGLVLGQGGHGKTKR